MRHLISLLGRSELLYHASDFGAKRLSLYTDPLRERTQRTWSDPALREAHLFARRRWKKAATLEDERRVQAQVEHLHTMAYSFSASTYQRDRQHRESPKYAQLWIECL